MTRHRIAASLSRFQLAEAAALRRARGALGIRDTDLHALRHLLDAEGRDERITARQLAATVGISPAGATFLIDRLERDGYVRRERQAHDRRAVRIVSTVPPGSEVRRVLGGIETQIEQVASRLSGADVEVVATFLDAATTAMTEIDPEAADDARRVPRRAD
ncbi:MAG: MarR family transcriptional regulator [Micrococcales bacterium]|nr:MarR family transcriptional regulator [Micrococcales bacterium]